MKKYIAIAVLLAAGSVFASAEIINLNPGKTVTGVTGGTINANRPFDGANNYTADDLKSIIDVITDPTQAGWYTGVGQGATGYSSDVTLTETGFNFLCRSGVSYEYVLAFVEAPTDTEALTMSFTSNYNVSASIWTFNKETEAISLLLGRTASTANQTFTATVEDLDLGEEDMIVFAWSGSAVGGTSLATKISVTGVSMTATTIPEPSAFGLLAGLGALALVGTRRRRR